MCAILTSTGSEEEDSEDEEAAAEQQQQDIQDATGTDVVNLRRTIYLTIMSSLDFEEAGHKLMKIQLAPGQVRCNAVEAYACVAWGSWYRVHGKGCCSELHHNMPEAMLIAIPATSSSGYLKFTMPEQVGCMRVVI